MPAWAGDAKGGVVSGAVAIPLAMGYGMFAFVSLGDDFFATGVLAGMWSALIVGLVCVLAGNRSITVYAPRITTTFYLGSVLFGLAQSRLGPLQEGGVPAVLAAFFAIVFLGGLFQALFGLMRLGTLIKFTPHPVMAGFQNAAALLLLLVQTGNVLGFERNVAFGSVPDHLGEAKPLSLLVAGACMLVMLQSKRWLPRVPPLLCGLAAGTACYYLLVAFGLGHQLGPVIGQVPSGLPHPVAAGELMALASQPGLATLVWVVVSAALGLAFIASVDALLCEGLLKGERGTARGSNAQLVRLGVGNMFAAGFGGITSGVNLGPSAVNRSMGATSARSVLVNAAVMLLTLLLLMPVLGGLPRAALSGVIVVVALQHFDPWTMQLLRRLGRRPSRGRAHLLRELSVVLAVALLSVVLNIVAAVFIGVLIAVGLFLLRMSRSAVRRSYRCDTVRSRKTRDAARMALLAEHGQRILVFELEGPIFFGSAERLASQVHSACVDGTSDVILDFRRVNDIDSTGARVVQQLYESLVQEGLRVGFCGLRQHTAWSERIEDLGLLGDMHASRQFPDVDRAIEDAEDALLASLPDAGVHLQEVPFESLDLLHGLTRDECETVRRFLSLRQFAAGEVVFQEGDPGTEVFVIASGRASVEMRLGEAPAIRLATFAAGTTFGELAILDQQPRSASIVADGALTCWVLSEQSFEKMKAQAPTVAIQLLVNLGRELSQRIRRANQMLNQFAS